MPNARALALVLIVVGACEGKSTARDEAREGAPEPTPAAAAPAPAAADGAPAERPTEPVVPGSVAHLIQLPDERPTELAVACQKVVEAYDGYMTRVLAEGTPDRADWDEKRSGQLKMTEMLCTKNAIIDVAACQQYAFEHAGPEHSELLGPIMRRCMEKFGGARQD